MTRLYESIFRFGLRAFPRTFGLEHGTEMLEVFRDRAADLTPLAFIAETIDLVSAGASMRLERTHARQALVVTIAAAMFVTSFALHDAGPGVNNSSGRIDFNAEDPAGRFTLTVIDGQPVGATVNSVPVSPELIVASADSISILRPDHLPVLTVAFNATTRRISWNPRASGAVR